METDSPLAVLERLEKVRRSGDGFEALCPAHDDRKRSLSLARGERVPVVLTCHAGCSFEKIRDALIGRGLDPAMLAAGHERPERSGIAATYRYRDEVGEMLYEVVRYSPKDFKQRRPDGRGGYLYELGGVRRVPYRLPELLEGVRAGQSILIAEGEKAVDCLVRAGFVATCSPQGAGRWRDDYARHFAGAKVAVLPDNDEPGRSHAQSVARSLCGTAETLKVVELPNLSEKGDVFDWISAGGTTEELRRLVAETPEWQTSSAVRDGLVLRRASTVRAVPVRHVWENRLPLGAVSLLVGLPSFGKTLVAVELSARISRGQLAGDLFGEPAAVLFASAEDSLANTLVPRLAAAGGDLDRVEFVAMRRAGLEDGLVLPDDVAALEDAVRGRQARLVVIDPLMAHVHGAVDSHRDHHLRRVLAPLARLAEATGVAILVIAHLNKAPGGDLFSRVGGSIGLTAAARSVVLAAADPEEPDESRVLVHGKANLSERAPTLRYRIEGRSLGGGVETAGIVWSGEASDVGVDDVLTAPASKSHAPKRDAAQAMLVELLGDGPRRQSEIKAAALKRGIGWRTVEDAKAALGVLSEQSHDPGRRGAGPAWWMLPDALVRNPQTPTPLRSKSEPERPVPQGDSRPDPVRSAEPVRSLREPADQSVDPVDEPSTHSDGSGYPANPDSDNSREAPPEETVASIAAAFPGSRIVEDGAAVDPLLARAGLATGWSTGALAARVACGRSAASRDPEGRPRHPQCEPPGLDPPGPNSPGPERWLFGGELDEPLDAR
jgi:putative DNA primase/helicase